MALKAGEKLFFGVCVLLTVAAVAKAVRQPSSTDPARQRDHYEWTEAGLQGQQVYRTMGCHNCHKAMGVGEMGVAPVLDGEGTRRTRGWLEHYFADPPALVPGSAHDGRLGPDFRALPAEQRRLLVEFLIGLKAGPASPNYPVPPTAAR